MGEERKKRGKPRGRPFLPGNAGKPKGTKHKATILREDLVQMILGALDARGGRAYLEKLNDKEFTSILRVVVPKNVEMAVRGIDDMIREFDKPGGKGATEDGSKPVQ